MHAARASAAGLALLMLATQANTASISPRSKAARAEFQRQNPCPATGKSRGPCPGWVVDHVVPLACGGVDAPANMQWQTVAGGKAKDREERRFCGRRTSAKPWRAAQLNP